MAKFELPIRDVKTGEINTTIQRGFIPVGLFIKYQKFSEELIKANVQSDYEYFEKVEELVLETFPELTHEDYYERLDVADVLGIFKDIVTKATMISTGNSKNG